MSRKVNKVGLFYGRLTVIERAEKKQNNFIGKINDKTYIDSWFARLR